MFVKRALYYIYRVEEGAEGSSASHHRPREEIGEVSARIAK